MSIEAMKQALEALDEITDDVDGTGLNTTMSFDKSLEAITSLRQAIEQAEEKNCKNCVIDKPCIAKGKDMQICGAFVSKHAKELKQIALDKKAENARGLGLDYEPAQAEKQEPVAWMFDWDVYDPTNSGPDFFRTKPDDGKDWKPLYTTPQPQQKPVAWMCSDESLLHKGYSRFSRNCEGAWNIPVYTTPQPQRERVIFPTMLRKMWSGGEVQAWLDENVNKEKNT